MGPRIKVVQFTHDLKVGGLQRVVETLCRTLDPSAFEVSVLCLRESGPLEDALRAIGVPVHSLERFHSARDHTAFLQVARLFREMRVDVVHTHNTGPFLHGVLGALFGGVRTVVHTDHARDFPDAWKYMALEHVLSHFAYRVVGVSDHSTENLRHFERIPSRKLVTIINGVDASQLDVSLDSEAAKTRIGIPPQTPVIGIAARLSDQKGIEYLLRAMVEVRKTLPDLVLVIAGDGPLEDDLREQARTLSVDDRVRFLGVRHDVPALLRAFDLFVLPSLWEGLPMVILEAMAAGCPVLASDVGGVGHAITHDVTGALVRPMDVGQLASEIIRLVSDRDLRATIAGNAKQKFHREFSASAMTKRYEALYRREPPDA